MMALKMMDLLSHEDTYNVHLSVALKSHKMRQEEKKTCVLSYFLH